MEKFVNRFTVEFDYIIRRFWINVFNDFHLEFERVHEFDCFGERVVVDGLLEIDEDARIWIAPFKASRSTMQVEDGSMDEEFNAL